MLNGDTKFPSKLDHCCNNPMIPEFLWRFAAEGGECPRVRWAQMRRSLAIAIVLLFGLAPVSALLPHAEESSLRACCRRNGAHHCAMGTMDAAQAAAGHFFAATNHCPYYGNATRATVTAFVPPSFALTHLPSATLLLHAASASAALDATYLSSGRGPPSFC